MPPMNKYTKVPDWKKDLSNAYQEGTPYKGRFMKSKRQTFSAEILDRSKKETSPGPGTYDKPSCLMPRGIYKCNEEKGVFIDEARFVGLSTPGAIYDTEASIRLTRPKIAAIRIYAETEAEANQKKRSKSEMPAPGSYDVEQSIIKTQWSRRIPQF